MEYHSAVLSSFFFSSFSFSLFCDLFLFVFLSLISYFILFLVMCTQNRSPMMNCGTEQCSMLVRSKRLIPIPRSLVLFPGTLLHPFFLSFPFLHSFLFLAASYYLFFKKGDGASTCSAPRTAVLMDLIERLTETCQC